MHTRPACFLVHLLLFAAIGAHSLPDDVLQLTTATFEHDTQASTGQTTGHWAVLFNDPQDSSQQPLVDLWDELTASEFKTKVFAQVDGSRNEALLKRFGIQQLPAVLLFKDRKMYRYRGAAILDREDVVTFLEDGHIQQGGETVPAPPPAWQGLLEEWVEKLQLQELVEKFKRQEWVGKLQVQETLDKVNEALEKVHKMVPEDPLQRYATYVAVGFFPFLLIVALFGPKDQRAAAAVAAARPRPHSD